MADNGKRPNPLEVFNNQELIDRYRLDRASILQLTELLEDRIQPQTNRSRSLSPLEKVLITLRYLASGEIQLNDADLHTVSQPTVSRAITDVLCALTSPQIVRQFIQFKTAPDHLREQCLQFNEIAGFPKVVGVIDGTHVPILAPSQDEEVYVNRKGTHSINVQVVFDASDKIIDIVSRWPGCTHDARILEHSGIRQLFDTGHVPAGYHLLGDSGYPSKRWLLTPYLNPQGAAQERYNRAHKRTRAKVERGIGQLKRRFSVLQKKICMKPGKACRVILACGILHNICKNRNIPLPPDVPDDYHNDDQQDHNDQQNAPVAGLRYRDNFCNTYF